MSEILCTVDHASVISPPIARIALAAISRGDFTRASQAPCEKNSGDRIMVSITARKSPSLFTKVCAIRSTSACGG